MIKLDIVGSIIVTLFLMLICYIFSLDTFGCILLMLFAFLVLQHRGLVSSFWRRIRIRLSKNSKKVIKKECKSSYEFMRIDE